jgi:hypothetical protein
MEHVGGLRDAADKITVADDDRLIGWIGVGQELDGRRIRVVGCAELEGVIGACCSNAVCVGDLFEGT